MDIEPAERTRLLAILHATARELPRLVDGLEGDDLRGRPAPGKWSVVEILCHMRDMEREAYLARYRRILSEERPALPDVDSDVYAVENDYAGADPRAVVDEWRRNREDVLALLLPLDDAAWRREGVHSTSGPLTMGDFLRRQVVGNDEAHLGQIRAIKERRALLARLESGPERLAHATAGLPDEELRRRPAERSWAVVEIACHLRDIERVFADRLTKMAFQETPRLWMLDNDRAAERRRYREESLASALADFRLLRGETLTLLRALPHPVWKRTGIHPTRGEVSIADLAGILAGHDDRHLARIGELRGKRSEA